jgi:hypothetical protein
MILEPVEDDDGQGGTIRRYVGSCLCGDLVVTGEGGGEPETPSWVQPPIAPFGAR